MSPLRASLLLAILMLTACASAPGIPDTVYFRLPPRAASTPVAPLPTFAEPIVVETLLADGLHSDQAIIYSLDPDGARLKAYHYQMWVDPPVRLLQRRLIGTLRDAGLSATVSDRLPNQVSALRIQGRLERFERIRGSAGWEVAVGFSLRAEQRNGHLPLVMRDYSVVVPAEGESLRDSVRAVGVAVDRLFADFIRDLVEAAADA